MEKAAYDKGHGRIRYWNVRTQTWESGHASAIEDAVLATLSPADRELVERVAKVDALRLRLEKASGVALGEITMGVDIMIETHRKLETDAVKLAEYLRTEKEKRASVVVEHDPEIGYFVMLYTGDK